MAKIGGTTGADYQADFDSTEKQGGSFQLLPHMYALLRAESIELKETKDTLGWQAAIAFEVVEPAEYASQKVFQYWTIVHPNGADKQYRFGKAKFDSFGRAIGVQIDADTDTDDLMFRTFVAEVDIEIGKADGKGGFYKDRNAIKKFFYTDADAKEPVPELGVIGEAANDNTPTARTAGRPVAAAAQQRPAGEKPWPPEKREPAWRKKAA